MTSKLIAYYILVNTTCGADGGVSNFLRQHFENDCVIVIVLTLSKIAF